MWCTLAGNRRNVIASTAKEIAAIKFLFTLGLRKSSLCSFISLAGTWMQLDFLALIATEIKISFFDLPVDPGTNCKMRLFFLPWKTRTRFRLDDAQGDASGCTLSFITQA